ncbi:hypothetical protein T069G_09847 [Trichoderma breve]|uniref:Prion-inhibition and propagation HeLo domain-containing protein n=1 Tax=Trichoderma breve TaxID=2034170 RepID=A0A9W9B869_9HYPO|nr:hypothetical protein T069G_09847 [Trichoderma breve]KAJ4856479.1 hypothetical protein T069G_09847 [Trichoderma breve]
MDAAGATASILHLLQQSFRRFKQARRFESEFRVYEIGLNMHLSRCATISRIIHDTNRIDNFLSMNTTGHTNSVSQDREPTAAEILSAVQDALRIAQREAAQIRADCSTQAPITGFVDKRKAQATKTIGVAKWAFYKRDDCNKFMEEISSIILHLEHQVDRERRTLESW